MRSLLRTCRKKTELSIQNISFLLSMSDSSTLSRCERGMRRPNLEIIFTYHILFQISIDKLFETEMRKTLLKIATNIEPLIHILQRQEQTRKVKERIVFLKLLKQSIDKKYDK